MISLFTSSIEELVIMKKITAQITSPCFLSELIDIHPPKRVRLVGPTASCSSFSSGSGSFGAVSAEEAAPIAVREERRESAGPQKGNYIYHLFITPLPSGFPFAHLSDIERGR